MAQVMKKIGIFGSYNYSSIGDTAILKGIINSFGAKIKNMSIIVFCSDPLNLNKDFKDHKVKNLRFIDSMPTNKEKKFLIRVINKNNNNYPLIVKAGLHFKKYLVKNIFSEGGRIHNFLKNFYDILVILKYLRFWNNIKNEIKKLDLLIVGGGNLLMDLYYRWPIFLLIYSVISKIAKVPLIFYAIGAGPIDTIRGRIYIRNSCNIARAITVRDNCSKSILKKIGIKKGILLSSDPAISMDFKSKKGSNKIGISFVPYYDPRYWPDPDKNLYEKYINFMADSVNRLLDDFKFEIVFFNTNFPADYRVSLDIYNKVFFKERVKILKKRLKVEEILSLISSCDFIIGSRLHSIILSTVTKTPFIAISYQPKVINFCKRLNLSEVLLILGESIEIDQNDLFEKILYVLDKKKEIKLKLSLGKTKLKNLGTLSTNVVFELIA